MYTDHRISDAEHARWFASAMTDETKRYWIIELDGVPVGAGQPVRHLDAPQGGPRSRSTSPTMRVRGRGVGSATDRFLIRHAFEDLGLDKLCVEVLATNERRRQDP